MQKFLLSGCRHRVIATTTPISGRTGFPLKGRLSCLGINNARRCYSGGVRYSSRKGIVAGSVVPLGMGTRCAGVRMQERSYATSSSSGKTEADEMVEELQDLYEIAKDEFEIATESTTSSTIYAPSDRTTAAEALSDLESLYTHYTSPPSTSPTTTASPTTSPNPADSTPTGPTPAAPTGGDETRATALNEPGVDGEMTGRAGEEGEGGGSGAGGVRANFNAEAIAPEVREEIRRRVGQRVRELRGAVEALEERAMED